MEEQVDNKLKQETLQKAKECDYIRFTFADMHGIPRCRIVPRKSLDRMYEEGVGLVLGKVEHFFEHQYGHYFIRIF